MSIMTLEQMAQDIITRETLELIAQQQQTTQLIILMFVALVVLGAFGLFAIRGVVSVFTRLSKAIDNLADIENDRHDTQKEIAKTLEKLNDDNYNRHRNAEMLFDEIKSNLQSVGNKLDNLADIIVSNPDDHRKIYDMLIKLNKTLQDTKISTDELDPDKAGLGD